MKFRVEVVCVGEDGDEARGEVLTMERHHLTMDTLGLTLRESKAMLAGVQDECSTKSGVGVGWQKCLQPHPSSD